MGPRIGITHGADPIDEYRAAVEAFGGEVLPLSPDLTRIEHDVGCLDGVLFSGGGDIDPARYGQRRHPATGEPAADRDAYELALMRAAIDGCLPALAICRGVQVGNVALGGTLLQHVPDVVGDAIAHRRPPRPDRSERGVFAEHRLAVEPDSRLHRLAGPSFATGSRHHQALDRVAPPLRVVARAPDGIVEAVELVDSGWFWLGVQWHPESTLDTDGGCSRALFAAFVAAAAAAAR